MSARGSKVLLKIAGAWWVGWCLSQHNLSLFQSVVGAADHHTKDAQRVTRPGFLCLNKYLIQAFLGVFEKKSGANVSKLYSTARGCSEVAT
jgi:hypothetical protein